MWFNAIPNKYSLHEQLTAGRQRNVTPPAQQLQTSRIFRRERHHLLSGTAEILLQAHHGGGLGPLDDAQQTFDGRHRQRHGGPVLRVDGAGAGGSAAAGGNGSVASTRPREVAAQVLQDRRRIVHHIGVRAHAYCGGRMLCVIPGRVRTIRYRYRARSRKMRAVAGDCPSPTRHPLRAATAPPSPPSAVQVNNR